MILRWARGIGVGCATVALAAACSSKVVRDRPDGANDSGGDSGGSAGSDTNGSGGGNGGAGGGSQSSTGGAPDGTGGTSNEAGAPSSSGEAESTSGASSAGSGGTGGSANDPVLWLRADQGVDLVDGAVQLWEDQSPAGHDATQTEPEARPSQVETESGLTTLSFDGVDDALRLPPGFADFRSGLTIVAVASFSGSSDCNPIVEFSNGIEEDDIWFGRQLGEVQYEVFEDFARHGAIEDDTFTMLSLVHETDSTVRTWLNGDEQDETIFPLPRNVERVVNYVGYTNYSGCASFEGEIAELLVYDRALAASELEALQSQLRERWSCCE